MIGRTYKPNPELPRREPDEQPDTITYQHARRVYDRAKEYIKRNKHRIVDIFVLFLPVYGVMLYG